MSEFSGHARLRWGLFVAEALRLQNPKVTNLLRLHAAAGRVGDIRLPDRYLKSDSVFMQLYRLCAIRKGVTVVYDAAWRKAVLALAPVVEAVIDRDRPQSDVADALGYAIELMREKPVRKDIDG